jgi:2-oxoglutarate dehydrogenase E1 component
MLRFKQNIKRFTTPPESFLNATSGSYLQEMYQAYKQDKYSVHVSWRIYFDNLNNGSLQPVVTPPSFTAAIKIPQSDSLIPQSDILDHMKVQLLVRAYQIRGYCKAKLDPLQIATNPKAPELDYSYYGFTDSDLDRLFYLGSGILPRFLEAAPDTKQMSLRDIIANLEQIYCGSIAVEYGHISDRQACDWLRQKIEVPVKYHLDKKQKMRILDRLMWSELFESFVSKKYPSEKRFGLEGCESLIPGMKALVAFFNLD